MEVSQIEFRTSAGTPTRLATYSGKVILVVNVASKCGLTKQYSALESIYEKYRDQGLVVIGFPANEFGGQEPGTNAEIQEFCTLNFGVKFPVVEKIVVKGPGQHPLYKELTRALPDATGDITWNFEKFLIDRKGQVVARFAPRTEPDDPTVIAAIEKELKV